MNERIRLLRQQSLDAAPRISLERARLLTEFHESGAAEGVSVPVARALALRHILMNKKICILPAELIVGERGPSPKATPTFPEICTHTLSDFDILSGREKISFGVGVEERRIQSDVIIPYWSGRSMRDMIFERIDTDWKDAYEAGIFTEFQEQRAPGHTVLDGKIYRNGFNDFSDRIGKRIADLESAGGKPGARRIEELRAMNIAAGAVVDFAGRHSVELSKLALAEKDPRRRAELERMSAICSKVPARAPDDFWEALQYYWFVHLGVITELNTWDSFNPGRLDRHLLPFYRKGLEDGTLTEERARELLQAFWIKFNNQPAPPKVGVTAQESNTYTDFCLINLGGVDEKGGDAVSEMTYLILDVIEEMRLLQPSSMVQISSRNPDDYVRRALRIISTGYGQPSMFNAEEIVAELLRQGKSVEDARDGGASGCVETGAFGKESYILTGYFNLPKVLELTLNDGMDPLTCKKIGLSTGKAEAFRSFEELYCAFEKQLARFIDIKLRGNLLIEGLWAENLPAPFMSMLIDDCIDKGMDYNEGGARYNTSYVQGVGLGTATDAMTSIKYHVFDRKDITMKELLEAADSDFSGKEPMRRALLDATPKYGNDDDYADSVMKRIFESFFSAVDGKPNSKGGHFRINMLPTTSHVYFGARTGALPDGRKSGEPLSEGISPVQGADRKGPTAVLRSAAKFDHVKTGGTLLNQKFTPKLLADDEGINKTMHLVRGYFRMMGHHIQFNVVTADTLKEAQRKPEKYRDLIVRVAGYSDYFVDLGRDLQDEIIKRTEHGA